MNMGRPRAHHEALPAAVTARLVELGRHVAIARMRRQWRQADLAEKAGLNPNTIRRVEMGAPGTSLGAYASVLWALGLMDQLAEVARPERDAEGGALEAARRGERVRPSGTIADDF
ncbi:MAG: helix-turn-helix domain-containing protein [Gemmatimonadaceae bacterium]